MKKMNLKKGFTHQNFLKKISGGFTLIELFVVVAIIGILASVVLVSLSNAKKRGEDTAVKTNLHTTINQAELFYLDNNDSYLPAGGSTFNIAPCPSYDASGTNMLSVNKVMADALTEAINKGNGSSCYNSTNIWAIAVGLKLEANTSWCVDNTGIAKMVNSLPSDAINADSFSCN